MIEVLKWKKMKKIMVKMSFSGIPRLLEIAGVKKILIIASSVYSVISEIFALVIFLVTIW
jgi:hypothetical protein